MGDATTGTTAPDTMCSVSDSVHALDSNARSSDVIAVDMQDSQIRELGVCGLMALRTN